MRRDGQLPGYAHVARADPMKPDVRKARRPYRGVTPERRDAERRGRLVSAALKLYAERRTAEVPVAHVCAAAQVSTRQFYEVFKGRDDLFVAVYEHSAAVALRNVEEAIDGAGPGLEATLRAMLERLFFAQGDELGKALEVLFVLGATSDDLMQRRVTAIANAAAVLAKRFDPEGTGKPSVQRMAVFLAAVIGLLELAWRGQEVASAKAMIDELMATFAPALMR